MHYCSQLVVMEYERKNTKHVIFVWDWVLGFDDELCVVVIGGDGIESNVNTC